jgi:transposase
MTKDRSHRELFMAKIAEGMSIQNACTHCSVHYRTGQRWLNMLELTGNFLPLRHRASIPGVMSLEHQDILRIIISNNRHALIVELSQLLAAETGFIYTERLVRQVVKGDSVCFLHVLLLKHLLRLKHLEAVREQID